MDETESLLAKAKAREEALSKTVSETRALNDERLHSAGGALDELQSRIAMLQADVEQLERKAASTGWSRAIPFALLGASPPLAFVGAFFLFDAGWWPLGLISLGFAVVASLTIPFQARRSA